MLQGGIPLLLAWVIWLYKGLKGYKVNHCVEYRSMGYVLVCSQVLEIHTSCCIGN